MGFSNEIALNPAEITFRYYAGMRTMKSYLIRQAIVIAMTVIFFLAMFVNDKFGSHEAPPAARAEAQIRARSALQQAAAAAQAKADARARQAAAAAEGEN